MTVLFLRFSSILVMFATTAFSASFLDEKIEEEGQKTFSLSAELDHTRRAAENVSEELLERIKGDIDGFEMTKKEVINQIRPLEQTIRENRYTISRRQAELKEAKRELGVVGSFRGSEETDRLEDEIDLLSDQNDELADEIDSLHDRIKFLDKEIARSESHLYEESDSFVRVLVGGIGSAWGYISNLASSLVDSTMSALVRLLFKMLLLPIGFLYALLKLFKVIWKMELAEMGAAVKREVQQTFDKNTELESKKQ